MAKAFTNDPLVSIGLRVPESLVRKIDEKARKYKMTRTDFLISVIEESFRSEDVAWKKLLRTETFMKNKEHYKEYAKQILQMPHNEAERTIKCLRKHNGDEETEKIISEFSGVLGGVKWERH